MSGSLVLRSSRRALSRMRLVSTLITHSRSLHSFVRPSAHFASKAWNSKYVRSFASATYPQHIKLVMPALSPTMEKGNLAKWLKKEGDAVKPGDTMAEVETDKATVAFDSVEEGYIAKIFVPEGTPDVPLGKLVAILVDSQEDIAAFKDYNPESTAPKAAPSPPSKPSSTPESTSTPSSPTSTPTPSPPAPAPSTPTKTDGDRVIASPLAKREASERGVDLSQIKGTGSNNRIVLADVQEFLAGGGKPTATVSTSTPTPTPTTPKSTPAPARPTTGGDGYVDKPLSNVRKVIAQRLSQSKQQIPHYYISLDVNMDKVLKLRADLNAKLGGGKDKKEDNKLSVNDFIIKAAALALKKVPEVNASWLDSVIREYKYVDVSVAVSTDTGLITPIVKDADLKGLSSISREVRDLAGRARQNKLQPAEFQGGTFTISNLGMFGITNFSAIINPPQSAILAVGATVKRVDVNSDDKSGENPYKVSNVMGVTLSADHRVIDGALGAVWLSAFKNYLEDPQTMLL